MPDVDSSAVFGQYGDVDPEAVELRAIRSEMGRVLEVVRPVLLLLALRHCQYYKV